MGQLIVSNDISSLQLEESGLVSRAADDMSSLEGKVKLCGENILEAAEETDPWVGQVINTCYHDHKLGPLTLNKREKNQYSIQIMC